MFYRSYLPSRALSDFVARYMIVSDNRKHSEWEQLKIFPNGLCGLGFSFSENFRYRSALESQREITSGNIIGIHNCCYSITWKDPIDFFIVIFKPAGLFSLLRTDMSELRNNLNNLNALGVKESEWICDNIRQKPRPHDKIAFMESWLKRKLAGNRAISGIVAGAAQTIIQRQGRALIGNISDEFGVNRRYLDRHFLLELGCPPKEFAGIVRFNYLNALLGQKGLSWKELAFLGNFHDQSHLIKNFHKLTGLAPSVYTQTANQRPEARFINEHNVHNLLKSTTWPADSRPDQ